MNNVHTMSPAGIVGCPAKVIWLTAFFSNSKHLFYDICVGCQLADIIWCWAKAIDLISLYVTFVHRSKVS